MHKLQLQLNTEEAVILQKFQNDVDAIYNQCFTTVHKIEKELSVLEDDNEKLTKDKSQILKERDQLLDEVTCLKIELAEKD